jgi:hypothetical protein
MFVREHGKRSQSNKVGKGVYPAVSIAPIIIIGIFRGKKAKFIPPGQPCF